MERKDESQGCRAELILPWTAEQAQERERGREGVEKGHADEEIKEEDRWEDVQRKKRERPGEVQIRRERKKHGKKRLCIVFACVCVCVCVCVGVCVRVGPLLPWTSSGLLSGSCVRACEDRGQG